MITIPPNNPVVTPVKKASLKVHKASAIASRKGKYLTDDKNRRKGDRRMAPFKHRGRFEMRSGQDRRSVPHIDEEV